jgi:hypothetical protein
MRKKILDVCETLTVGAEGAISTVQAVLTVCCMVYVMASILTEAVKK